MQLINDGEEVYVEYGHGARAYSTYWEGRPATPDFEWDDGVVLPSDDLWLGQLDLTHEGVDALVDKEVREQEAGNLAKDLAAVKALLKQHAGSLQACFLIHEYQVRQTDSTATVAVLTFSLYSEQHWFGGCMAYAACYSSCLPSTAWTIARPCGSMAGRVLTSRMQQRSHPRLC